MAKEEYKDEYDPQIDFTVGAILTMFAKKHINNFENVLIDEDELPTHVNLVSKPIKELGPLIADIAESKLRGSRFFYLSRFWEDWNNRTVEADANGEHPAMVELRDVIAPKILGFHFYKWYTMENESYGYPYFMDSDFLDLAGGEASALATIWHSERLINTFLTLKEFKEHIKDEYKGDFTEFDKYAET